MSQGNLPPQNPYAAPNPYANPNPYAAQGYDPQARAVDTRELAGRGARLGAQILDGLIGFLTMLPGIAVLIVAFIVAENDGQDEPHLGFFIGGIVLMCVAVLAFNIWQWVLLSQSGQTIGKRIVGVRVVLYGDGGPVGFGRAVGLRIWVNGLIGAVPYVGMVYSLFDILFIFGEERRCIHDLIAGTKVVVA